MIKPYTAKNSKETNDKYYSENKEKINEKRRLMYKIDEHYRLVCKTKELIRKAIRDKEIERPMYCSFCKRFSERIEAHHEDYSKPFIIIWLCHQCHKDQHRIFTREEITLRRRIKARKKKEESNKGE